MGKWGYRLSDRRWGVYYETDMEDAYESEEDAQDELDRKRLRLADMGEYYDGGLFEFEDVPATGQSA